MTANYFLILVMHMNNVGAVNTYYTYIMTNSNHTALYTGVTGDLINRCHEHRNKKYPTAFTARYNINKLVWYEEFNDINKAIAREKQIKGGNRQKKIQLIESINPAWNDLFETKLYLENI